MYSRPWNSVAGRPHEISDMPVPCCQARPGERTAVTGARHRDLPVLSLLPEAEQHVGLPGVAADASEVLFHESLPQAPGGISWMQRKQFRHTTVFGSAIRRGSSLRRLCLIDADLGALAAVNAVLSRDLELEHVLQIEGRLGWIWYFFG